MKKECSTCKKKLDIKYFSFRSDTNKFRGQCKKCHKGYSTDRFEKQIEVERLLSKGLKKCSKCENILDLGLFHKDKNTKTGFASRCKYCIKEINSNKCKKKKSLKRIKNLYGIEEGLASKLLSIENCQICSLPFDDKNPLCIDHCHNTGVVRGVLCRSCNTGIGLLKDDVKILNSAISYLTMEM